MVGTVQPEQAAGVSGTTVIFHRLKQIEGVGRVYASHLTNPAAC